MDASRQMGVRRTALGGLLVGLTTMAACTATVNHRDVAPTSSPTPSAAARPLALTRTITANGITFHYPPSWRAQRLKETSSFTNLLATMSTRPVPEPCHAVPHGVDCGALLSEIGPSDVLVSWVQEGMPGQSLAQQPGASMTVDGHPARLVVTGRHFCPRGTAAEVDAALSLGHSQSHDEMLAMTACAGPHSKAVAVATALAVFDAVQVRRPA